MVTFFVNDLCSQPSSMISETHSNPAEVEGNSATVLHPLRIQSSLQSIPSSVQMYPPTTHLQTPQPSRFLGLKLVNEEVVSFSSFSFVCVIHFEKFQEYSLGGYVISRHVGIDFGVSWTVKSLPNCKTSSFKSNISFVMTTLVSFDQSTSNFAGGYVVSRHKFGLILGSVGL